MDYSDDASYRLGSRLAEVSRLWRHELDARLRPLGLSTARWVTLTNLSAHPEGLTQNALAILVGIKGSTLVRQLDLLEADGWVVRRDSPDDRRVKKVFVTPKARPALDKIALVGGNLRRELLDGIEERDIHSAIVMLDGIKQRLHDIALADVPEAS
jgi:MarR family transcriptional regulator, transcriptional regulator for hemolysin